MGDLRLPLRHARYTLRLAIKIVAVLPRQAAKVRDLINVEALDGPLLREVVHCGLEEADDLFARLLRIATAVILGHLQQLNFVGSRSR